MKRKLILLSLLICSTSLLYSQKGVSGYIESAPNGEQRVILSKSNPGGSEKKVIAVVQVERNGYFSFDDSLFTPRDEIYNLEVRTSNYSSTYSSTEDLDPGIKGAKSFILSNKDSLFFYEGPENLLNYVTNSEAEKEWQKLKKREKTIDEAEAHEPDRYAKETRNYVRDSLEILLVKLISIQTLDEKDLLERDIKENPEFYLDLLQKLHKSDLDPSAYAHYENKIRAVSQDIIERKYYVSTAFNVVGLLLIVFLGFWLFRIKKQKPKAPLSPLSRQESNVKALIIEGKSNKEIAEDLFISISTVKTHITNIYSKLNVANRKELMAKNSNHTRTST